MKKRNEMFFVYAEINVERRKFEEREQRRRILNKKFGSRRKKIGQ